MATSEDPRVKLTRLRSIVRELGSVLVCYSGGIDSALVLAVAHQELGPKLAVGMTALSPSFAQSERDAAETWAKQLGATHRFVQSQEIHRPDYVKNGPDRCFHCKTELYEVARQKAIDWTLSSIANGTNLDDQSDYRPGLRAAEQAKIRSPLFEAELRKDDVRAIAQLLGMPIWDKPASACLASRIPYGTSVTWDRLRQVERLEASLHSLGFVQVRVRHHEELARIEVPLSDLARLTSLEVSKLVEKAGREAGYRFVTVDLRGYRPGSLNETLPSRSLPVISD